MFPVIGGVKLKKGDVECCICIALMSFDWPNEPRSHMSMRPRLMASDVGTDNMYKLENVK